MQCRLLAATASYIRTIGNSVAIGPARNAVWTAELDTAGVRNGTNKFRW